MKYPVSNICKTRTIHVQWKCNWTFWWISVNQIDCKIIWNTQDYSINTQLYYYFSKSIACFGRELWNLLLINIAINWIYWMSGEWKVWKVHRHMYVYGLLKNRKMYIRRNDLYDFFSRTDRHTLWFIGKLLYRWEGGGGRAFRVFFLYMPHLNNEYTEVQGN